MTYLDERRGRGQRRFFGWFGAATLILAGYIGGLTATGVL